MYAYYGAAIEGMLPLDGIDTIVRLYLQPAIPNQPLGFCPLSNLGGELCHAYRHIHAVSMEGYQRLVATLSGRTRRHCMKNPVAVGTTIVLAIVGAVTLAQMAVEPSVTQGTLDGARDTVRTLLSLPNRHRQQAIATSTRVKFLEYTLTLNATGAWL